VENLILIGNQALGLHLDYAVMHLKFILSPNKVSQLPYQRIWDWGYHMSATQTPAIFAFFTRNIFAGKLSCLGAA